MTEQKVLKAIEDLIDRAKLISATADKSKKLLESQLPPTPNSNLTEIFTKVVTESVSNKFPNRTIDENAHMAKAGLESTIRNYRCWLHYGMNEQQASVLAMMFIGAPGL